MNLGYEQTASARMTTQMSNNGDGSLPPVVWSCGNVVKLKAVFCGNIDFEQLFITIMLLTRSESADRGTMDQAW